MAHRVGNPNLGPPTRPPLSTTATCQQEKTENWTDKHWPPTRTLGVRVGARQSRFQTGENYDAKYSRNVWNNADGRKGCCQRKRHGNLVTTRYGSPARIRTSIHGSKGRCPTIRRPGNGWSKGIALPVYPPAPLCRNVPAPCRYNGKRKAIWTGVWDGLQNRSAAVEVAGVFDSHCLPPSSTRLSPFNLGKQFATA